LAEHAAHRLITKEEDIWLTKSEIRKYGGKSFVAKEDGMNWRKMADKGSIGIVGTIYNIAGVRVAALSVLVVAFSATAMAQCGDSLSALAAAATSIRSQSQVSQLSVPNESAAESDKAANASIVGLWHIRFRVGDQTIQEAFQIWNAGGTEVHNPNVDPRGGRRRASIGWLSARWANDWSRRCSSGLKSKGFLGRPVRIFNLRNSRRVARWVSSFVSGTGD
jgi:hypothetical protein